MMWYYLVLAVSSLVCLIVNVIIRNPYWFAYAINIATIVYCGLGFAVLWSKRRSTRT